MGPPGETPTVPGWWGPPFSDHMEGHPHVPPSKLLLLWHSPPRVPLALTADPPKLEHFNMKTLITWGGLFVLGLAHRGAWGVALEPRRGSR